MKDMIKDLERFSTIHERQTVVIDAGIATEENLEYLNSKDTNTYAYHERDLKTMMCRSLIAIT